MKLIKSAILGCLLALLCITTANAAPTHNHTHPPFPESIKVSAWAREEVDRAISLGFGPRSDEFFDAIPDDFTSPITRGDFCIYTSRLIAVQQGCDEPSLTAAVCHYMGKEDDAGRPISVFNDTDGWDNISALYYLGIVQGRGEDSFDFGSEITRQEAATLLARTYNAYGGTLPEAAVQTTFTDETDIADWARDNVRAMATLGIMKGYEDGRFAPNAPYSNEQCLMTLLRLYENLPVSRKNGNVTSMFTYEQYTAMLENKDALAKKNNSGTYIRQRVDGPIAAFVETETGGSMNSATFPRFIYRSGAMRSIDDLGVCDSGRGYLTTKTDIEDPHFSEDGRTFFCAITLTEDVADYSNVYPNSVWHGHEAGIYQVSIDVETLKIETVYQAFVFPR